MEDTTNPLIPGVYDVVWVVTPVLVLALMVIALVSISRTAHRSRTEVVVWVLVVLLAPVLGSIAWLAVKASLRRPTPQPPVAYGRGIPRLSRPSCSRQGAGITPTRSCPAAST
jgi:hypothetical protein